jgi:hypothetical protein
MIALPSLPVQSIVSGFRPCRSNLTVSRTASAGRPTRSIRPLSRAASITPFVPAVANALAPDGATLEEAAARRATNEALAVLFERYEVGELGIENLNRLDADGAGLAVQISVSSFIYQRWLQDLGQRIEERAFTSQEAVRLEHVREEPAEPRRRCPAAAALVAPVVPPRARTYFLPTVRRPERLPLATKLPMARFAERQPDTCGARTVDDPSLVIA